MRFSLSQSRYVQYAISYGYLLILALVMAYTLGCAKQTPTLSPPLTQHKQSVEPGSSPHNTIPTNVQTSQKNSGIANEYDDEYDDENGDIVSDPLEPFNRAMFTFNDKLYSWVLKPTATVYASIFPKQFRKGIRNVLYNIAFPIRFVSSILQLKPGKAAQEIGCFTVNTTFGIGGLVKISDHIKPLQNVPPEDLGQTFARYGLGDGFYIVWPVLGPSTLRDSSGKVGEYFLDPINYIDDWKIALALKTEKMVNYTSLHQKDYDDLKKAAIDPYEALKDFYIQYRQHLVRN